ncbi:MAG: WYL domain-containing protein [Clostridia bacterium]|nr:WYL domain-containing protein [Clostridia bacterium]
MTLQKPKKMIIMNILDILRRHSDAEHRLSQKDIIDIMKKEHDMVIDRKTVRRNILTLLECGYEIEYNESVRLTQDLQTGEAEETYVWSDFYLSKDISDSELRLLIDSLMFSKSIPYNDCKELIEKLKSLSNIHFNSHVSYTSEITYDRTDNKHLFLNIELLSEAIDKKKKVSFNYTEYKTDKKLHIKTHADSSTEYIVSPYQMASKEGKYYLICNFDKYDDISNYRIDRIMNIKILDEAVKPFEKLKGSNGQRLNLEKYMNERVYMFSDESTKVKFRISKPMISDVIDVFGKNVAFSDEDKNGVSVTVYTNKAAMKQFAKSFAPDVIVLEPHDLRDNIRNELKTAIEKYEKL